MYLFIYVCWTSQKRERKIPEKPVNCLLVYLLEGGVCTSLLNTEFVFKQILFHKELEMTAQLRCSGWKGPRKAIDSRSTPPAWRTHRLYSYALTLSYPTNPAPRAFVLYWSFKASFKKKYSPIAKVHINKLPSVIYFFCIIL